MVDDRMVVVVVVVHLSADVKAEELFTGGESEDLSLVRRNVRVDIGRVIMIMGPQEE
jgi:hypothetical protein